VRERVTLLKEREREREGAKERESRRVLKTKRKGDIFRRDREAQESKERVYIGILYS